MSGRTVRMFGKTAILVGKGVFEIAINDQEMKLNMVFTEVYQKEKLKWKLIARHVNGV